MDGNLRLQILIVEDWFQWHNPFAKNISNRFRLRFGLSGTFTSQISLVVVERYKERICKVGTKCCIMLHKHNMYVPNVKISLKSLQLFSTFLLEMMVALSEKKQGYAKLVFRPGGHGNRNG